MYKIERKSYGFKLTFGGFIQAAEMQKWIKESETTLASSPAKFGIFVDMRNLKPLPPDAQTVMQTGQKLYKQKGMNRSVVILSDAITTMQFKRIAKQTGIYAFERYLDASKTPGYEKIGIAWIQNGVDPDK
jgi:hypothetical protein